MKKDVLKRVKLLIAAVLVLFLGVVVVDIAPEIATGFRHGWEAGADTEASDADFTELRREFYVSLLPVDPVAASRTFDGGVEFLPDGNSGELALPAHMAGMPVWHLVWKTLSGLALIVAIVTFIVNLVLFAVGFPRRPILSRGNIVRLRWMSLSLVVFGVVEYSWLLMDYFWLRSHISLEGYRIGLVSPSSALIVALILVVLTEIMNLAGRLQTEQDLTI